VLRVDRGDHHQRDQVVDHREGQQADPQAGAAGRDQRQDSEREGGVGRHRGAPAMGPAAAPVEREVDPNRHRHPTRRRDNRDRHAAPLSKLPGVELALGLEADDEEEERHQALIDPMPEIE
jgi:hypothetical protein